MFCQVFREKKRKSVPCLPSFICPDKKLLKSIILLFSSMVMTCSLLFIDFQFQSLSVLLESGFRALPTAPCTLPFPILQLSAVIILVQNSVYCYIFMTMNFVYNWALLINLIFFSWTTLFFLIILLISFPFYFLCACMLQNLPQLCIWM